MNLPLFSLKPLPWVLSRQDLLKKVNLLSYELSLSTDRETLLAAIRSPWRILFSKLINTSFFIFSQSFLSLKEISCIP